MKKEHRNDKSVNYKFADTTFKLIFQHPEGIVNLLDFLGIDSTFAEIEKNLITSTLFESRENDLSFLLRNTYYYFVEHQSSLCPNMPFRLLLYVVEGLQNVARIEMRQMKDAQKHQKRTEEAFTKTKETSEMTLLYSDKLIHLPEIKCYHFLTGVLPSGAVSPDIQSEMFLSDTYKSNPNGKTDLELIVHCLDFRITEQEAEDFYHNHSIPNRFSSLDYEIIQYAMLVGTYKGICRSQKYSITSKYAEKIIRDILSWYTEQGYLQRILNNREETNMIYDMLTREDLYKEEGRIEGRKEGRIEGRKEGIFVVINLLQSMNIGIDKIQTELCTRFSLTEEESGSYIKEYLDHA